MILNPRDVSVLLIDDSRAMRTIVAEMLRACGFPDIHHAADAREALDLLARRTFELAFMDLHMPGADGLHLLKKVRSGRTGAADTLPVIVLTGDTERATVRRVRDAGASGLLAKPISAPTLIRRLNTVLMDSREFIRSSAYRGPDRRSRRPAFAYAGPFRRAGDVDALRATLTPGMGRPPRG